MTRLIFSIFFITPIKSGFLALLDFQYFFPKSCQNDCIHDGKRKAFFLNSDAYNYFPSINAFFNIYFIKLALLFVNES